MCNVRAEVTATETGLLIDADGAEAEAHPVDDRAFVVDAHDPDNPTVTFGAFGSTVTVGGGCFTTISGPPGLAG